jgi:hypothetical protein
MTTPETIGVEAAIAADPSVTRPYKPFQKTFQHVPVIKWVDLLPDFENNQEFDLVQRLVLGGAVALQLAHNTYSKNKAASWIEHAENNWQAAIEIDQSGESDGAMNVLIPRAMVGLSAIEMNRWFLAENTLAPNEVIQSSYDKLLEIGKDLAHDKQAQQEQLKDAVDGPIAIRRLSSLSGSLGEIATLLLLERDILTKNPDEQSIMAVPSQIMEDIWGHPKAGFGPWDITVFTHTDSALEPTYRIQVKNSLAAVQHSANKATPGQATDKTQEVVVSTDLALKAHKDDLKRVSAETIIIECDAEKKQVKGFTERLDERTNALFDKIG